MYKQRRVTHAFALKLNMNANANLKFYENNKFCKGLCRYFVVKM